MLADRGNDGNVVLGVGRVQERVESAGPRSDLCERQVRLFRGVGGDESKKEDDSYFQ